LGTGHGGYVMMGWPPLSIGMERSPGEGSEITGFAQSGDVKSADAAAVVDDGVVQKNILVDDIYPGP